jgi:hypothetical protein
VSICPRCGEDLVSGQEYCVECGLRLPGPDAVGVARDPGRGWIQRSAVGLLVAAAGAAVAVAASGGNGGSATLLTATGGFATTPAGALGSPPGRSSRKIVEWPAGQEGWTIALASLPQTGGRRAAVARARRVLRRGLRSVGIIDSSRYASLHPGYWVVYSGVYTTEAEATGALGAARAVVATASVRHIVP